MTLLQHLRRLTYMPAADAVLLSHWIDRRDEAAFAALVARHGPMVLGVCQRVLGNAHETEDAFQATFLILARKAASLRRPEALACWLHGVAARLALKARAAARRRADHSRTLGVEPADPQPDPLELLTVREMLALIDAEIRSLREVYRLPLVLCDLEGRTQEDAAALLGWTAGSLRGRLLRGRARLKERLARRGLTLPAAIVLPLLPAAGLIVSPRLIAAVTQTAVRFSMDSAAIPLSSPAVELAKEGLRLFSLAKVKIVAAVVLMTLFIAGAGLVWQASGVALAPREAEPREAALGALTQPRSPAAENPPVRRDCFGDPLPNGAVARLGTVRFRQGSQILTLAFSPDGKTVASGGIDNAARLWDIATGKELHRFTPEKGPRAMNAWVTSLAFSPDGKLLATAKGNSASGWVIWDVATGKEVQRFRGKRHFTSIAFAPDGKAVAASDAQGQIRLWSVADGAVIREFKGHQGRVEAIAFSPDGKILASAGYEKTIRLWDMATGRELRQLKEHTEGVLTLAFSRDGKKLASGGVDHTICLWDPVSGKLVHSLVGHSQFVHSLAFFPDGKKLVSGGGDWDRGIRFWDTDAGRELPQIRGTGGRFSVIALSPDGQTLAFDNWGSTVHLWDVAKDEERTPTKGSQGELWHVAFAPDGKRIATGGLEEMIRLWDPATGNEILHLRKPKQHINQFSFQLFQQDHLQFAADSRTLSFSRGSNLSRWRTDTGKMVSYRDYRGISLLPTPDSKFVIEHEKNGDFYLLDAVTGKKLRSFKAPRLKFVAAGTAAVSPDSKFLAINAAEQNGTVVIWELATGKERCRCKGAPHLAYMLTFSPDGKYLAGATFNMQFAQSENASYLWDAATGRLLHQFQTKGHYVKCLAFSSDGRMLASGGGDRSARLWEVATGQERRCYEGHQGIVRSVAFSPDNTRLVSASSDTTALVWDATAATVAGKPTAKQLQAAWSDLAGDAAQAYRAIWLLARHPHQSVPLLREHVPPARALDGETSNQVERWLADLDSDDAAVRERASAELEKRVVIAERMLRNALSGRPSLEQRKRIERVLERLEREQVKLGRAIEALEHTRTPESRQLLETLAAGAPDAWLTREAKTALTRLVDKPR